MPLEPFGHWTVLALRDEAMNDDDKKPERVRVLKEQLTRYDYKDALRSRYQPVANTPQFDELLKRLEETERKK